MMRGETNDDLDAVRELLLKVRPRDALRVKKVLRGQLREEKEEMDVDAG